MQRILYKFGDHLCKINTYRLEKFEDKNFLTQGISTGDHAWTFVETLVTDHAKSTYRE